VLLSIVGLVRAGVTYLLQGLTSTPPMAMNVARPIFQAARWAQESCFVVCSDLQRAIVSDRELVAS
jgi:hypothetical protein